MTIKMFAITLGWIASALSVQAFAPAVAHSVCDVIEHLEVFRGKEIEIRGDWRGGYITGNCRPPKTESYVWATSIWLEFPQNVATDPAQAVGWKMDREVWRKAEGELKTLLSQAAEDSMIEATLVGRLDSPARLMVFQGRPSNGYGAANVFPARLVIKDIKDIRLSEKKLD